jgi:hypothetical protein
MIGSGLVGSDKHCLDLFIAMTTSMGLHLPISSPPRLQSEAAIAACTFITSPPAPAAVLSVGTLVQELVNIAARSTTHKPVASILVYISSMTLLAIRYSSLMPPWRKAMMMRSSAIGVVRW